MLHKYECNFYVNGRRTQEIVSAVDMTAAKKLIETKYGDAKITWAGYPRRID